MIRFKKLILNFLSICIILLGSVYLMQGNAIAEAANSTTALVAQCPDGTCGETCGSAKIGPIEVCVCTGECPESDEPGQD